MAVPGDTDRLRTAAAEWSLEGDRKLLDLLQSIHQQITSKCQETNSKLDAMVAALDDASVSLQNVNNRFMALSNTQFVESRVYEDDTDVATVPAPAKKPAEQLKRPEDTLLKGLITLEAMHEAVTILDSDSDSDEDAAERESIILKPKDLYTERPLPYIIGSQNWKNKWHAGLILEESDTESTTSRHSDKQFSESESDEEQTNIQPEMFYSIVDADQRVGSEESLYKPQMTKVYKPYPPAAALFPEEPPPIEQQDSDWGGHSSESDHDIFAELHRTERGGTRDIHREQPPKPEPVTQKPNLFQQEEDANMFTETPNNTTIQKQDNTVKDQNSIKKPVGAISLFGSNKGTESIGAAILKRNQRKSSSDESDDNNSSRVLDNSKSNKVLTRLPDSSGPERGILSNPVKETPPREDRLFEDTNNVKSEESSIFDELFAKSEKRSKEEVKKVDIFSDIFDDIDDIFTNDVKKEEKKPSLFDDDLFSKNTEKENLFKDSKAEKSVDEAQDKKIIKTKSIFDDDEDDLFVNSNKKPVSKPNIKKPSKISQNIQKTKSIFDSDSDDGDIFSKIRPPKPLKDDIKPTQSSNHNFVDSKIADVKNTDMDTGSKDAISQSDKVPITSKTDNNIEAQPSKTDDFDKENILNTIPVSKNEEIPSNNYLKETNNDKASDDDWETDLPSNDEDNDTKINIQVTEKPKILEKPKLIEKPHVNAETINESTESDVFTVATQSETDKNIKTPTISKDTKEKHVFDDIFGNKEPPMLEDSPTTTVNKPSSIKPDVIAKGKTMNHNETIKETEKNTDQFSKAQLENDIFDDLFMNPPVSKDSQIETTDIFSDIPPPITEKVKEAKNTNINALFGDDSDDESLFFKSEPAMDDVPPISDALDTIFHDEPPDFDIDFMNESITPKPDQHLPPNVISNKEELKREDISANRNKAVDETDQSEAVNNSSIRDKGVIVTSKNIDESDTTDTAKTIGKLKPMSFNINVNTLLPGASPKKSTSKPESTVTSPVKTLTEPTESPEKESKLVKSVSFDSDPDSLVLDNKISKERAKIQVKRRPSTRRARKEAARKSGIDFVDAKEAIDDIDTSDSAEIKTAEIRDVSQKENSKIHRSVNEEAEKIAKTNEIIEKQDNNDKSINEKSAVVDEKATKNINEVTSIEKVNTRVLNINNEDIYIFKDPNINANEASRTPKDLEKPKDEQIMKKTTLPKKTLSIFDDEDDDDIFGNTIQNAKPVKSGNFLENVENISTETDKIKEDLFKTQAKSGRRLVVTDDDEDIFGASNTKKGKSKEKVSASTKITDDNTDIFKTISKSTKNNQKSFLDDDDDDLFAFTKNAGNIESSSKSTSSLETSTKSSGSIESGTKDDGVQTLGNVYKEEPKSTKSVNNQITGKAKSIFDDSSDEELFGGKKSKTKTDSLFSKATDEDLFSKKNAKKDEKKVVKATLFDDEDDYNLFATRKTDKEPKSQPTQKPTQTQEKPSKSQEIVFNDPLSMFDDD